MKNNSKIAVAILVLPLASCISSRYEYENCPGLYTITPIVPVELQQKTDEYQPNTNTVVLYPGGEWRKTGVGPDKLLELTEGRYRAVSLKGESGLIVQNGVSVSVQADADGAAGEPGDFTGGYIDFETHNRWIDPDVVNFNLPTYIQTRVLILKVKIEGSHSGMVDFMTATVDGIALSRDLNNAFSENGERDRHPALSAGYAAYTMEEKDADGFYTGARRLLGLDGDAAQNLLLTVHFKDGFQKQSGFDITADLSGFHTKEVDTPWVIRIVLREGADFSVEIENWTAGPEEWLDAGQV